MVLTGMAKMTSGFKLIVHVGAGKTGSSSIQKTLGQNLEKLREQGIAYLGLMFERAPETTYSWQKTGGWPIFFQLKDEQKIAELTDVITKTIDSLSESGIHTAIWSNESLFANYELLEYVLSGFHANGVEVEVVAYVRRHDAWARSSYLQWGIKHKTYSGPIKNFKEWCAGRGFLYSGQVEKWTNAAFANVHFRNFDATDSVVPDFLNVLNISGLDEVRANETPDATLLTLWALYNNLHEDQVLPVELERLLARTGLLNQEFPPLDTENMFPDQDDMDEVWEDTKTDRERVNKILKENGQPPFSEDMPKAKDISVDQSQINAALLKMIKSQQDVISELKQKIGE